jgi:hypothetical protein
VGNTTKALNQEVKNAFKSTLSELKAEEKLLTKEEKKELRIFLYQLHNASLHMYAPIFIRRKIKELIAARGENIDELESIEGLEEDGDEKVQDLMRDDLKKIAEEMGVVSAIECLTINMDKCELKSDIMKALDKHYERKEE